MARVRNRQSIKLGNAYESTDTLFSTAIYVRLSDEEALEDETQKIFNQKNLLLDYVNKNSSLKLVNLYIDNGFSGRNFQRPRWLTLMDDIKTGIINCIVVKDLSRLGRNYLEAGNLLEKVFPLLGIRFISVNDNYDSMNGRKDLDYLSIPIKNIMNQSYSADLSKKITSARKIQRSRGDFTTAVTALGYKRKSSDKCKLEIDENTAYIIKYIFNWLKEGMTYSEAANQLNKMAIPSPNYYSRRSYGSDPKKYIWTYQTVRCISKNEVYIGNMVQGAHSNTGEIIRVENSHNAIISKDIFFEVQKRTGGKGNGCKLPKASYLFKGLLKDSCHHIKMFGVRYFLADGKTLVTAYKTQRMPMPNGGYYPLLQIKEDTLIECMKDSFSRLLLLFLDMDSYSKQKKIGIIHKKELKQIQAEETELSKKKNRVNLILTDLYTDYADELINRDEYFSYSKAYKKEAFLLEEKTKALLLQKKEAESRLTVNNTYLKKANSLSIPFQIDPYFLIEFVETIFVVSSKKIEIRFKFEDEIKLLLESCTKGAAYIEDL